MRTRTNHIKAKRERNEPALGVIVQTGNADNVEMAGAASLDFVVIDTEHGSLGFDRVVDMLRAADGVDITPLVRVPDHTPHHILRALDAGAMGVVVPNVATAAQAQAIVQAAKYRTADGGGNRGSCPSSRANWHLARDWPAFARWSNEETTVWLLIEDEQGIRNIDAILDVPGIGAIVPGPFDLAQAMGHAGDIGHPEVVGALRRLVASARARKVDCVAVLLATTSAALAEESTFYREIGCNIFWIGGDRRMMSLALARRKLDVERSLGMVSQAQLPAEGSE